MQCFSQEVLCLHMPNTGLYKQRTQDVRAAAMASAEAPVELKAALAAQAKMPARHALAAAAAPAAAHAELQAADAVLLNKRQ